MLFAIMLLGIIGVIAWQLLPEKEPVYQGKRLSRRMESFAPVRPAVGLVVPVLVKALGRPDNRVQDMASTILRSYGRAAVSVVPDLIELLKSQNQGTRFHAALCLLAVDPDAAAEAGVDRKALGL